MDVTATTTLLGEAATIAGTVGASVILILGTAMAYRMVRRAFS